MKLEVEGHTVSVQRGHLVGSSAAEVQDDRQGREMAWASLNPEKLFPLHRCPL